MLLVTLIFAVLAAAASYLARSFREDGGDARFVFVLFILAGPPMLLIAVALFRSLTERRGPRERDGR